MPEMTYREALRETLREALRSDERVFLIGEDIGKYGGAYAVTMDLLQEFGPKRIKDSPITESVIVGIGIGAALAGLRPVVEIMTINFTLLAADQIINHAAKIRYMSGGQLAVPLVIRTVISSGSQLGAQHSQSLEGWYASVPGLKVVEPATPADARGLLRTALRDMNTVLFVENAHLYGIRGPVPDGEYEIPFGLAEVKRAGRDITVISYGRMVQVSLQAAQKLADENIEAEVVDLRSLLPLDMETVIHSLEKTNRAIVVEEAWKTGGFGAEVVARIQEHAFDLLDAPVLRISGADVPAPYASNLQDASLPNVDGVVGAVRRLVGPGVALSTPR